MSIPIRIAVCIDFGDGSQHEYEVRGPGVTTAPGGLWPEGVCTEDQAKRIQLFQGLQAAHAALAADLATLRTAVQRVLDDEESQHPGGWGPDVTMVAVLKEAMDATA